MLRELNPLLHSQLRLAVMSILMGVEEADFVFLKEKTQSTAGNLSCNWTNYRKRDISRWINILLVRKHVPPVPLLLQGELLLKNM